MNREKYLWNFTIFSFAQMRTMAEPEGQKMWLLHQRSGNQGMETCTEAWKPSLQITALTGVSVAYSSYHSISSLNNCDLFFFILVTRMKQLNYCKIVKENFNFAAQDILAWTWLKILIFFPEPWAKHSLDFSRFFLLLASVHWLEIEK